MKKIFFLIFVILISFITSQKEKEEKETKIPKLICTLKNRSYESCYWYTRNLCCNKNQIVQCQKNWKDVKNFSIGLKIKKIKKELK
jgi:hypothetical protein